MIHLDTSFLIRAFVGGTPEDQQLRSWLRQGVPLGLSAIVWAEFLCGPVESDEVVLTSRVVPDVVPFVPQDSLLAAELFNLSGRRRGSMLDCMIAATAIRVGAALATTNSADFRRLEPGGLKLAPA